MQPNGQPKNATIKRLLRSNGSHDDDPLAEEDKAQATSQTELMGMAGHSDFMEEEDAN